MKAKISRVGEVSILAVVLGCIMGLCMQLLLTFFLAYLITNNTVTLNGSGLLVVLMRCIVIFVAGIVGAVLSKTAKLKGCIATLAMVTATWLFLSAVVFDGAIVIYLKGMVAPLIACLCAVLLIFTKNKGHKFHYKKGRYR